MNLPLYEFPDRSFEVYPARCYPDSAEQFGRSGRDGRFTLAFIPNGTWRFHFQSNNGQGKTFEAVEEITVQGVNVQGVQVVLAPGADIPVEIDRPPGPAEYIGPVSRSPVQANAWVQVQLLGGSGKGGNTQYWSSQLPNSSGAAEAQPSFAILGVQLGQYEVKASANGGCIGSVSSAGADLSREPLVIAPGTAPAPIVVDLRNDCATLNVSASTGSPDASGFIVLISDAV
jgi:hypothetical protein